MNPPGRYHIDPEGILREFAPKKVVVLTGAGISVASGISPFRGPRLWEKYDRKKLPILKISGEIPVLLGYAERGSGGGGEGTAQFRAFIPGQNGEKGFISSVITQNIDGLHQKAGNKTVIEYHGNTTRLIA